MTTLQEALTSHAFFHGMRSEHLALLAEGPKSAQFQAGESLFEQGQPANQFYLIQTSKIALESREPPKGTILVEVLNAGNVLGWWWMYPPYEWQFSARAMDPVEAVAFCAATLRARAEENHDFGFEIMNRLGRVILETLPGIRRKLVEFYVRDLVE